MSSYLVVGPDGDLELRQDSLHLQVPLGLVHRRLQDLLGFGGRPGFLSEHRQQVKGEQVTSWGQSQVNSQPESFAASEPPGPSRSPPHRRLRPEFTKTKHDYDS